jgi:sterol desaturase/sphingolipid hydroxylase (fatty acid hydroxylase superfamily)
MDSALLILACLRDLYATPFTAMFVFGAIFLIIRGPKAFKLSEGTVDNVGHNLLLILINTVTYVLAFGFIGVFSIWVYQTVGLPHVSQGFWDTLPYAVTFIITLFVLDFANYWAHKILHTKWFWGFHALHHSDEHMTWTTSYRIHVFELALMKFTFIFLAGWLFLPPDVIATAAVARFWLGHLNHCQLGWTFGPLRKWIASPNYHRWHHSVEPEAFGKNLCDMFPIWDIMFGTHYDPGLCETDTGVPEAPKGFVALQLYPLTYAWSGLKRLVGRAEPPALPVSQSVIPSQIP